MLSGLRGLTRYEGKAPGLAPTSQLVSLKLSRPWLPWQWSQGAQLLLRFDPVLFSTSLATPTLFPERIGKSFDFFVGRTKNYWLDCGRTGMRYIPMFGFPLIENIGSDERPRIQGNQPNPIDKSGRNLFIGTTWFGFLSPNDCASFDDPVRRRGLRGFLLNRVRDILKGNFRFLKRMGSQHGLRPFILLEQGERWFRLF